MAGAEAKRPVRPSSLADALIAVGVLITLIAASFLLYGDAAILGPTQVALTLAATVAAALAWKNGHNWDEIRQAVTEGIASALPANVEHAPASDTPAREVRSAPARPSPKSIRDTFSREQQFFH